MRTAFPTVDDERVKTTCPFVSLTELEVESVSVPPRLEERVTDFPETGFELPSTKVTVIVEVAKPSPDTRVGDATTVELDCTCGCSKSDSSGLRKSDRIRGVGCR